MTAQCVGGPPQKLARAPGVAACARDAWAWGRHRECQSRPRSPRGRRSFGPRGGLVPAQTEGGRVGVSCCQTPSQAHLPFPGLLTEPFPLADLSAPQEAVTYHLKDCGPRLGVGSSVPPVSCRVPAAAAQPKVTVLGPSDRMGLPPLSQLCIRLWELERLPSPPGQGRVDYRRVGPQPCCLLLCKL